MNIDTEVINDGVIESTISAEFNGRRQEYCRQILRTQDEQVREALMGLGWTPPESCTIVMEFLKSLEFKNDDVSDMRTRHAISQLIVDIRKVLNHGS
jgi:hypothetical protein